MQKYYSIADHIIALRAADESPVWKECGNYAPFETETPGKPRCSLEIVDSLDIPEAESVYEVREKDFPRLCFSRFIGGWVVRWPPRASSR